MQINRLFEIIYILLDKKTVTSKVLAERFEVSVRTIYRDIDTLSSAGVPVYMTKGKGGGISLLPDFVLNKTVLTDDEKNDILSSLKAVSAINFNKTDQALNKLNSLFGETNADWIEVDFSTWSNSDSYKDIFISLKSAIISKRVITFTYSSGKGEKTKRTAEPLKLCFKGGSWYLYSYCRLRENFRFFKLNRVRELTVTDEFFKKTAPTQIFSQNDKYTNETIPLKLKLSPKMAYRVYDEFENYDICKDGSFIAMIDFPKSEWLFYYLSSFGSECEVLEPLSVRNDFKTELEKIIKKY